MCKTPKTIACAECGQAFTPRTSEALYCSKDCKTAYNSVCIQRGKVMVQLAQAMRTRGADAKGFEDARTFAFREMCSLLDAWNADDKRQGRMAAIKRADIKRRSGWRGVDIL